MELEEAKKLADFKKREKQEEKLAKYVSKQMFVLTVIQPILAL